MQGAETVTTSTHAAHPATSTFTLVLMQLPCIICLSFRGERCLILLDALEDDLTAVRRDIEVANMEVRRDISQLPFDACRQIDQPEVLVLTSPRITTRARRSGRKRTRLAPRVNVRLGSDTGPLVFAAFIENVVPMSGPE